jgi:general secretion pathway protein K
MPTRRSRNGSALLTVLWLSAALAAVAFALSNTVRSETDRASTAKEGLRCEYLASAGIERASMELLWSALYPAQRMIPAGATQVDLAFPTGMTRVRIIPETAELNVNTITRADFLRLATALGMDPVLAANIALELEQRRNPLAAMQINPGLNPTFQAQAASFQNIEDLLQVRGMTPEILFGTWEPAVDAEGRESLAPRPGLADCLSVYGSNDRVDANTAPAPVLAAVGMEPQVIGALLQRRAQAPLGPEELSQFLNSFGSVNNRLRVGGNTIVTLRATARLKLPDGRLSDVARTSAAQIKFMPDDRYTPIHILRWYDAAWGN